MKLADEISRTDNTIEVDEPDDLRPGDVVNIEEESLLILDNTRWGISVVRGYLARSEAREAREHVEGTEVILVYRPSS